MVLVLLVVCVVSGVKLVVRVVVVSRDMCGVCLWDVMWVMVMGSGVDWEMVKVEV